MQQNLTELEHAHKLALDEIKDQQDHISLAEIENEELKKAVAAEEQTVVELTAKIQQTEQVVLWLYEHLVTRGVVFPSDEERTKVLADIVIRNQPKNPLGQLVRAAFT